MKINLWLVVMVVLLLISCSGPVPQTIEITKVVQQTVLVTQMVTVIVTATPVPPTATPEATPTSTFGRWSTDQAAAAITSAGLEFASPAPMTPDDYGIAPMVARNGVRFLIPSLCSDCGGRLYAFDTPENLELMRTTYESMSQQSAMFFSWIFVKDNILIQINGDLPEAQAMQYKAALEGIK